MSDTPPISKTDVIQQIYEVAADCSKRDWDGYDAAPVQAEAVELAVRIVESIPDGTPLPEATAENDGEMALDWMPARGRTLSVSTSASGTRLPYAWSCGINRGHGVAGFDGSFPQVLLMLIGLIYAKENQK